MTVTVPEVALSNNNIDNENNVNEEQVEKEKELLDGGFVAPKHNAFGHSFRDYEKESLRRAAVEDFYRKNHINQTLEFAQRKKREYGKLEKAVMSIWECCELLNEYIDESDPDLDEPQIEHLLQTAEAIRRDYPNEDWLHLTALIHDLGKVLLHPAFGEEPQWSVVGDTYPLGCAFSESIVHHQFFKENHDYENPNLNTKFGIYEKKCGLDKVTMSWGHDEYMYLVSKGNNSTLPPTALFIIRFHSFYGNYGDEIAEDDATIYEDDDAQNLTYDAQNLDKSKGKGVHHDAPNLFGDRQQCNDEYSDRSCTNSSSSESDVESVPTYDICHVQTGKKTLEFWLGKSYY